MTDNAQDRQLVPRCPNIKRQRNHVANFCEFLLSGVSGFSGTRP
jgi:hypothetical protein